MRRELASAKSATEIQLHRVTRRREVFHMRVSSPKPKFHCYRDPATGSLQQ